MTDTGQRPEQMVPLGYVSGVHGVKGWVKVHSWTEPREEILKYRPWYMGEEYQALEVVEGRAQSKTIVARIPGIDDRESARTLVGIQISVKREQLPDLHGKSWYWSDLVGLQVTNTAGVVLGTIEQMMETGAHDVMVVSGDRQRLIPFVNGPYVKSVDLEDGNVVVDWDPDFLE